MTYRTLCEVLEEMRKAHETRNFSYLPGLIEEAQTMGNRMEAGLWAKKDYEKKHQELRELKEEIKKLKTQKQELTSKNTEE